MKITKGYVVAYDYDWYDENDIKEAERVAKENLFTYDTMIVEG